MEQRADRGWALAAATARAQAGDAEIDRLARRRDAEIVQIRQLDEAFVALSSADSLDTEARRNRLRELQTSAADARLRLDAIEQEITTRFPRYAELADGLPAIVQVQRTWMGPHQGGQAIQTQIGHVQRPHGADRLLERLARDLADTAERVA